MTIHTLGTPKPGKFDPNLADRLNKEADDEARAEEARQGTAKQSGQASAQVTEFSIEAVADSYRITGVPFRGDIYNAVIGTGLLSSEKKLHAAWIDHAKRANELGNGSYVGPCDQYHAIFDCLYMNRQHPVHAIDINEAREGIAQALSRTICTASEARYSLDAEEYILHYDEGIFARDHAGTMRGAHCDVTRIQNPGILNALFGTDDHQRIVEVYQWLCNPCAVPCDLPPMVFRHASKECMSTTLGIALHYDEKAHVYCVFANSILHTPRYGLGLRMSKAP